MDLACLQGVARPSLVPHVRVVFLSWALRLCSRAEADDAQRLKYRMLWFRLEDVRV